jgi:hypothetical protein
MDVLMEAVAMAFAEITASDRIRVAARRMTAAACCAVLAAAFATASVGCAVAALWIFVLPEVGLVGAPLIAAAALLFLCLSLLAIVRSVLRRQPAAHPAAAVPSAAVPALLIAEASRLFDTNKGAALLAALLAGAAAGGIDRK